MFWHRRKAEHLVPLDDVARIIEACAKMYEAGRKSAMPDIPAQISLTPEDQDSELKRLQSSGARRILHWLETGATEETQ